jgi:hypothetical protein
MLENSHGAGRSLLIAADVTGTIVHIQQGRCVTRDGVPAPDGSAPVSDAVLKSGDGGVLDWIFDRDQVPGVEGFKAYIHPMADLWRELLLRSIFYLAQKQNVDLPLLWLWPRDMPAVAHMSHDTDSNEPPNAWKLLELLKQGEINSTWCVILPGYDNDIMQAIKKAGHEFATHYDAMTEGLRDSLRRAIRPPAPRSHANVWRNARHQQKPLPALEGDMEFFEWCAKTRHPARSIQRRQQNR